MANVLIASTHDSAYFGELIASQLAAQGLGIERKTFPGYHGGERHLCLELEKRNFLFGKQVVFVGSTHTDAEHLEVGRIGAAAAGYGARQRVFVIPFLGYSTMERAKRPGEVVTAKTNARDLSHIPNSGLGNALLFMDLHVAGLVHYFEGDCLRFELYSESVLIPAIQNLGLDSFVFGTPDLGRADWVERFADILDVDLVFVRKQRKDGTSFVRAVIGDVSGKTVVVYDDMTRTAVTAINAAHAYLENGAKGVYLALSHFAANDENVVEMLQASPFKKIILTNTHPMSQHPLLHAAGSKFQVLDVSPIFTESIQPLVAW